MRFTFKVEAEAMRISGKFGRHDKIANDIKEALLEALPERLTSDGENHYEIVDWVVEEQEA
jgi:hypothetical protein